MLPLQFAQSQVAFALFTVPGDTIPEVVAATGETSEEGLAAQAHQAYLQRLQAAQEAAAAQMAVEETARSLPVALCRQQKVKGLHADPSMPWQALCMLCQCRPPLKGIQHALTH